MTATDKMCELFVMRDPKSSEALNYCSKSSDADRLTGHAGMFSIKAAAGDYQSAVRYLYRGIDRSFIYNHNPSKLDHQFAAPSSSGRKKITETYLKFAGENLYGASLESLGFPEVQIAPLMKSRRYPSGTIVNSWMGLVKTDPLMYISAPQKVSFTIFIVPEESGSVTGMTGEATPLYCYLKDEEGNFLKGSQYDAACGYLAIYNDFFAAVDVNGRYAPAFVYGQAEIRTDFVAVLD
jgi:hypothetical protein